MYTKIYWLHQFDNNARLGIMARPRGGEWLNEEIAMLKKQQVRNGEVPEFFFIFLSRQSLIPKIPVQKFILTLKKPLLALDKIYSQ